MENKHDLYRGKYCMKKFCESLRELEQDLILQFMNQTDHYLKEKIKEVIRLMKDEVGEKIMTEFAALRPKTFIDLTDDNEESKQV